MTEIATNVNNEMLNEVLIAKLLEEDIKGLENARLAEEFQLNDALSDSALAVGRLPEKYKRDVLGRSDHDVILNILSTELTANKDALVAQALQSAESNKAASWQYAQKLAAAEKKCLLDAEFAKRLQQTLDDDTFDETTLHDAESILGQDAIDIILVADMNSKGKGKSTTPSEGKSAPVMEGTLAKVHPTCGICMESFQATHSPVAAARSANSSARLQFGTHLSCPRSHGYCISCLNGYINSKLDPEGNGTGSLNTVVFPIRCPECSIAEWPEGIPNAVAEKVLSEKGMALWHHQKLLDSVPRYYCPNPRCSALVQVDEDAEDPEAFCPSCNTLICVPCRVVWHSGLSCEEYQALPLDERSPEDQKALQLMKAQHWRRCPSCAAIVELTMGCNHITCLCKTEFCFKCGALWDVRQKSCSRVPSCELWDEDMLLEEREREREREQEARFPRNALPRAGNALPPPPAYLPPDQYIPPRVRPAEPMPNPYDNRALDNEDLSWMEDPDVLCARHWFTANMIKSLTCQYCDVKLTSVADLRYHLGHVRRHPVYACCGRFFKREVDFERHQESSPTRFGVHAYVVERN